MIYVKYKRSPEGERRRLASLPKGKAHWNWSSKPTVLAMHRRIHRKYGPAKNNLCARACGRKAFDWAFIGKGHYTDNIADYIPLCRKCHIALDGHSNKVDRSKHKIIRDEKGRIKNTIIFP